jgi:hypothetical protein
MLEDASSTSGNGRNGRNGRHGIDRSQFQGGPLPPFGVPRDFAVTELNDIQPPVATLASRYPYFDWSVYDRRLRAVRTLTHKYIRASTGAEELYAVVDDPGELRNLAATEHSRAAQLRAWLDTWEANTVPAAPRADDRAAGGPTGRPIHTSSDVQG